MMTFVLCLVSFGSGVIAGAAALHWIRDSRRAERTPREWRGPHIEINDPDYLDAILRGDV